MRGKSKASLALIEAVYEILESIRPASVRAVCYQLFNRRVIPDMSLSSTRRVGAQLVYAREHEMIPWESIVDETREAERVSQWQNAAQFANAVERSYRRDRWQDQPGHAAWCTALAHPGLWAVSPDPASGGVTMTLSRDQEVCRQKILAILARDGGRYAVAEDHNTDPVLMALATPKLTCEVQIPGGTGREQAIGRLTS